MEPDWYRGPRVPRGHHLIDWTLITLQGSSICLFNPFLTEAWGSWPEEGDSSGLQVQVYLQQALNTPRAPAPRSGRPVPDVDPLPVGIN